MGRLTRVAAGGLLLATTPGLACASPPRLQDATIVQLDARFAAGALTSERLVRFYLQRIRRIDRHGPRLGAVLAINPDALSQARALDRERRAKGPRGPLHGIPILVKDNIETADALATTAGSLALAHNVTGRDSPLVARLRAAGAVILGKANLSEWANFRSTNATSGWSAVGGLTRNAYAPDHSACGSSSGSAVAVAAGLAAAAVGTETNGSITCPASMNGVVGFKPSVGQVPRTHIVPLSHSQDTPGPITRSAQDAALLMAAMSGADAGDPASQDPAAPAGAAFGSLPRAALQGMRLGVLRYAPGRLTRVEPAYAAALERLRRAGTVLVEVALPRDPAIGPDSLLVLETEFKAGIAGYLSEAAPAVSVRSLADLIAFNRRTPAETKLFGQELFDASQKTTGLDDAAYRTARARSLQAAGADGIDRLLEGYRLDALVAVTTGPAWRRDLSKGDDGPPAASLFPAVAGYPHLTVPMALVGGLPVGLSFIGGKWSDARMLALGAAWRSIAPPLPPPSLARRNR